MYHNSNKYMYGVVISCILYISIVFNIFAQSALDKSKLSDNIAHEQSECIGCHNMFASIDESFDFRDNKNKTCKKCHNDLNLKSSKAQSFHLQEGKQCLDCHSYHNSSQISIDKSVLHYDYNDPLVSNHCINCHAPERKLEGLLSGHFEASSFYHDNSTPLNSLSPSEACLSCHSNNSDLAGKYTSTTAPRFFEHASHIYGQSFIPSIGPYGFSLQMPNNPLIKLIDGKIECQTCHHLTSGNTDLLVIDQPDGQICISCHRRNDY